MFSNNNFIITTFKQLPRCHILPTNLRELKEFPSISLANQNVRILKTFIVLIKYLHFNQKKLVHPPLAQGQAPNQSHIPHSKKINLNMIYLWAPKGTSYVIILQGETQCSWFNVHVALLGEHSKQQREMTNSTNECQDELRHHLRLISLSLLKCSQPSMWENCSLTYMFMVDSSQLCCTGLIWGFLKLILVSNQLQKYLP